MNDEPINAVEAARELQRLGKLAAELWRKPTEAELEALGLVRPRDDGTISESDLLREIEGK